MPSHLSLRAVRGHVASRIASLGATVGLLALAAFAPGQTRSGPATPGQVVVRNDETGAISGTPPVTPTVTKSGRRELIFWGVSIGADDKGQDAVIREFERRHPDIHVKILSMGAGGMNPQKLMTSIVGNVAPDLIAQDRFSISDWASRGAFRSLDDFIERDKNEPGSPTKDKYYPAPWAEASYDGKVYAIPTGADNRILYYNRTIFRQKAAELRAAGLDPERA
ncbi:extracellular solute-binding protein, partial [bacterium]